MHEKDLAKRKDWKAAVTGTPAGDNLVVMIIGECFGIAKQNGGVVRVVAVAARVVCVRVLY